MFNSLDYLTLIYLKIINNKNQGLKSGWKPSPALLTGFNLGSALPCAIIALPRYNKL